METQPGTKSNPLTFYKKFLGDFPKNFKTAFSYANPNVYKAVITNRRTLKEHVVAVKEFQFQFEEFEDVGTMAGRWKALLTLTHPNLVAYHRISTAVEDELNRVVLAKFVMDYCNGGSLEDLIQEHLTSGRRLDVKTLFDMSLQITKGLQFLHENKVIHGDLKTSGIMLDIQADNSTRLRIAGWDHCFKLEGSHSSPSDVTGFHGTIRFASHEMLKHLSDKNQTVGRKTDIWSLGCVVNDVARCCFDEEERYLYSTDTGEKLAIEKDGTCDYQMKRISEKYAPYPTDSIPMDFANEILRRCCNVNVHERPSAECLYDLLIRMQEFTYGSTWKYLPKTFAPNEKTAVPGSEHRPTVEKFGRTCEYDIRLQGGYIAEGTFGIVLKAAVRIGEIGDYKGSLEVAVKTVRWKIEYIDELRKQDLWDAEKTLWKSLLEFDHSNLVVYHKVTIKKILSGTAVEFMMDYCEGGNFATFIQRCMAKKCALTESAMWNYVLQMAEGLAYLHQKRFVLGDLKPSNVLIKGAPESPMSLLIADLDGAVMVAGGTVHPENLKGLPFTYSYMAPELAKWKCLEEYHSIDFGVDVWGLGCILLDLIECYLDIKERAYWRNDSSQKPDIVYRQKCVANDIAMKLAAGYVPCIPEQCTTKMKEIVTACLNSDARSRITSKMLVTRLLETSA